MTLTFEDAANVNFGCFPDAGQPILHVVVASYMRKAASGDTGGFLLSSG